MFELIILFNLFLFVAGCFIVRNDFKKFKEKTIKRNNKIIRHLKSHSHHMYDISCENEVKKIEDLIEEIKNSIK